MRAEGTVYPYLVLPNTFAWVTLPDGTLVAVFHKKPDLISRSFELEKQGAFEEGEETRLVLGTMMMVLLERARG